MVLETSPMLHWSQPTLVLSPTETFIAAAIGGTRFDEAFLKDVWMTSRVDDALRADIDGAAAYGLHLLLQSMAFEAVYHNPSPFLSPEDQ